MGRTSKRTCASGAEATKPEAGQGKKQGMKYCKAGIYARLSSGQGGKDCGQASENEARTIPCDSIETQIKIAEKYVEDWNQCHKDRIEIVGRYTDV